MTLPAIVPDRLTELEAVIERGVQTFVEVGEALLEIRESRLYREGFATFEDYCRERWGWNRRYADRTIEAAAVVALLGPIGPKPENEAQTRELVPLLPRGPEVVREVWGQVIERAERDETPITGPIIRNAVREHLRAQGALAEDEMQDATAWMSPAERQGYSAEMSRQRGELTRLVRDLGGLQDPAVFIRAQAAFLLPQTIEHAEQAHAWLTDFLRLWRDTHAN